MGVGVVLTPAIVISLGARLLRSNREKPAFAHHSSSSITLGGSGAKFPKIGKLYINYLMIQLCKFTPLKSTSW